MILYVKSVLQPEDVRSIKGLPFVTQKISYLLFPIFSLHPPFFIYIYIYIFAKIDVVCRRRRYCIEQHYYYFLSFFIYFAFSFTWDAILCVDSVLQHTEVWSTKKTRVRWDPRDREDLS